MALVRLILPELGELYFVLERDEIDGTIGIDVGDEVLFRGIDGRAGLEKEDEEPESGEGARGEGIPREELAEGEEQRRKEGARGGAGFAEGMRDDFRSPCRRKFRGGKLAEMLFEEIVVHGKRLMKRQK